MPQLTKMTVAMVTNVCKSMTAAVRILPLALGLWACGDSVVAPEPTQMAESWAVTAWGKRFEVYPEVDALVAGEAAAAHVHVTRLEGFAPMTEGSVEIVLSGTTGEQVFRSDTPARPGIFNLDLQPDQAGDFELTFRIQDAAGEERIRGGRVRVGSAQQPGGVIVAPAPKGATDDGEPLPFGKEEQWRSDFATSWVRTGKLARSVSGLARIQPPAGGEVAVSSPVDGVLQSRPGTWPFPGQRVERGNVLFRIAPRVAAERSLATLESQVAAIEAERGAAESRLGRLTELLDLAATSRREVEAAQAQLATLEAQHLAASRDLASARAARGGGAATALQVRAPFTGEVAEVATMAGSSVAAGEPLARLVRTDSLWIDIALAPGDARSIEQQGVRGIVLTDPRQSPIRIEEGLRWVAASPEVSPATGTVSVLLEAPATAGLSLGTTLDAQILSGSDLEGIVIPSSALVDDGGVTVVYLQLSGEAFARNEVQVLDRQGDRVRVGRLQPGQRLVHRGGEAIRRSSLMASGSAHGHVH